jgi:hypothetical protein
MRYSVLILLAFAFRTGVLENKTNAAARVPSLRRLGERSTPLDGSAKPAANDAKSTTNRLGNHYLMLVNTAVAFQMDTQKMTQFDRSPYDGLGVSFWHAYDTSPVFSVAAMDAQIASWKKATTKDIWPWVYLNRMVGANVEQKNDYTNVPYFQRFRGLDLADKQGAQKDFLANWGNSLRAAKDSGVPGIVCDLELYNDDKAYDPGELARMTAKSPQDVVELLRQLGARMADSAAAEYPGATLWFLFTGFNHISYRLIEGQSYYPSSTYIAEGLLDQIQQHQLPLRVLSGGEMGLGYCHSSVEDFRQDIQKRAVVLAPVLQKYRGILELAGTMTVWSDRSAKRGWVAQGGCGASSAATIEDLEPYMELLFRSYRYNWIYGSGNGGYFAFQPDSAPRFDAAISQAKTQAFGAASR